MSDKPASPFARLDTDLLRSTRRPELTDDPETQSRVSGNPETLKTGIPESLSAGLPVIPHSGKPETLKYRKEASRQTRKPANPQTRKSEIRQAGNPEILKTGGQASGEAGKYSTQLRAGTIKQIKRYALDHDLKDYEVVQAALDAYFGANNRGE